MKDVFGEEYLILKKRWLIFLIVLFLLMNATIVYFLWSRNRNYTIIEKAMMVDILKTIKEVCSCKT
jgi:hypothetical protein